MAGTNMQQTPSILKTLQITSFYMYADSSQVKWIRLTCRQMPYLHWETDRSRHKFEESMRIITDSQAREEVQRARNFTYLLSGEVDEENELAAEEKNKRPRKPASKPAKVARPKPQANGSSMELLDIDKPLLRLKTPTEMVKAGLDHEVKAHPTSKISKAKVVKALTRGMLAPATALGRVLYRAAQLSEAMEYYQEEQLLKEFLHSNPPYHPRRTLDQSYYWTLQSTKKRDRDQVVYRGTAPKKDVMHKLHCKTEKDEPPWPCRQCYDDIRKVPRVIMVDQLWLWILDGSKLYKLSASSLSFLQPSCLKWRGAECSLLSLGLFTPR
jgi:hypothetical protein